MKGTDTNCAVTTRCGHIIVADASTTSSSRAQYNLLEHLGNTPAQISILDLLRTLPVHQEILNKALQESHVPNNIDPS